MMLVPSGQPASSTAPGTPPSRWSFAPLSAPRSREKNVEPRNGRDRRERLAAKAQRADGGQILRRAQFARRVAQEGRRQLARRDAAAVVADAKIGHAAVFHLYRHALRAGVDGVFQQLLDNARRALDHLARGDEVGNMRR